VSGNASRFLSIILNRLDVVIVVAVVIADTYVSRDVGVRVHRLPHMDAMQARSCVSARPNSSKVRVLRPSYTQTSETLISPSS
jgi:hypothetical protein